MALDIDKVRAASISDFCALALCEFSRFVDAVERIAPDEAQVDGAAATPPCPCPPELRQKNDAVMGEPVSYSCGLCKQPTPAVEA